MDLGFCYIETGKFYQIKENDEWSDVWYCGEVQCGCNDYKILQDYKKEDIRVVPFYKRFSFNSVSGEYTLLSLVLGFIFGYLIK